MNAYQVNIRHSNGESDYIVIAENLTDACVKAVKRSPYIGARAVEVAEIGQVKD